MLLCLFASLAREGKRERHKGIIGRGHDLRLRLRSSETHILQRVFRRILCQAFLAETVETGTKNRYVFEATHVCEESLGKIKFRTLLNLDVSVHEFYRLKALITLEQVNTTEWSKKMRILISKTAMVGCCKLSLYANGSCDEHAVYFRR